MDGDRFRIRDGEIEIIPAGETEWITEAAFRERSGYTYTPRRTLTPADYETSTAAGAALARRDLNLPARAGDDTDVNELQRLGFGDPFALERARQGYLYAAHPDSVRLRRRVQFVRVGWYVPHDRVMPLGDNRDNSRDGRYFGPVHTQDVLGRAMFIYWPFGRIGPIR